MDERACNFFDLGYNVKKTRKEVNDGKNTTLHQRFKEIDMKCEEFR